MKKTILNLSDPQQKGMLLTHIRTLQGSHRITIVRERVRRSDLQNKYYHGVIVDLFADWLRENGYDGPGGRELTNDDAHEMFRDKFLGDTDVVGPGGEVIGKYRNSTADLDTKQFIEYEDRCAQFLAEFCGIAVPPPDPFYRLSVQHENQQDHAPEHQ